MCLLKVESASIASLIGVQLKNVTMITIARLVHAIIIVEERRFYVTSGSKRNMLSEIRTPSIYGIG